MTSLPTTLVFVLCCVVLIESCGQTNKSSMQQQRMRARARAMAQQTQTAAAVQAGQTQRDAATREQERLARFQQSNLLDLQASMQGQGQMASAMPVTAMPAAGRRKRRAAFGRRTFGRL